MFKWKCPGCGKVFSVPDGKTPKLCHQCKAVLGEQHQRTPPERKQQARHESASEQTNVPVSNVWRDVKYSGSGSRFGPLAWTAIGCGAISFGFVFLFCLVVLVIPKSAVDKIDRFVNRDRLVESGDVYYDLAFYTFTADGPWELTWEIDHRRMQDTAHISVTRGQQMSGDEFVKVGPLVNDDRYRYTEGSEVFNETGTFTVAVVPIGRGGARVSVRSAD